MTRIILAASVAAVALAAALPAMAAEIEGKSEIAAVTVFPDGAVVNRTLAVDLPSGASTLVLRGLPLSIDPASLRIEGQASGTLTLGAVEARLRPVDPAKAQSEVEAQLRPLREERERIAAETEALEGRKAMIQRFAQSGPERREKAAGLEVDQWEAAWEAVGKALAKVNEEIRLSQQKRADVEAKIKALELSETARRSRVAPQREFTVALEAGQPLKGTLTVSYRVGGAGWRPAYDARLTTAEGGKPGGLTLARRALVTQRTGEDWSNVELTLSTTRAARGTAAPEIDPQRVAFFEPAPIVGAPMARYESARDAVRQKSATLAAPMASVAEPAAPPPRPIVAAEATLDTNGFEATYRIPGKLTVPTDGSQKSFVVQSRDIQPELLVRAAPALDPTAYLEAAFVNAENAPLLAGEVNLIRDNNFVGRGRMAFTAPGDKVSLGFGADDRVKVTRVPLRRRETEPTLLGSTKSDTREFKITIRNLHDFPVKTSIVDQIPFSEASNLTVEALSTNTPATEKIVQDKRGVMGWTYDLKPNEEREIRLGYRMRWPSDREIVFQNVPNPK